MKPRLLFVMNSSRYFVLNGLPLAEAAKAEGYEVGVAVPNDDPESSKHIETAGLKLHKWPLRRLGLGPITTLWSLFRLYLIILKFRPNIVHSLTIKPIVISGWLCRMLRIRLVVLIAGRGLAFQDSVLGPIATVLYRVALKSRKTYVCFQNEEDRNFFIEKRMVRKERSLLIPGSGVDTKLFAYEPYTKKKKQRVVTLASRLLREKGILEYLEAAVQLRRKGYDLIFRLAGAADPDNPSSFCEESIANLCRDAGVEFLGYVDDMPKLLGECDIFCHPSYYPEGVPMSLLQAASRGKALVTTDMPGCRDVVINEETGLVVPPRSGLALANAIERLTQEPELCEKLTTNCRKHVEENFTREIVYERTISLYSDAN